MKAREIRRLRFDCASITRGSTLDVRAFTEIYERGGESLRDDWLARASPFVHSHPSFSSSLHLLRFLQTCWSSVSSSLLCSAVSHQLPRRCLASATARLRWTVLHKTQLTLLPSTLAKFHLSLPRSRRIGHSFDVGTGP